MERRCAHWTWWTNRDILTNLCKHEHTPQVAPPTLDKSIVADACTEQSSDKRENSYEPELLSTPVTNTADCSSPWNKERKNSDESELLSPVTPDSSNEEKRRTKRRSPASKRSRMPRLLQLQDRLVVERGLPRTRLQMARELEVTPSPSFPHSSRPVQCRKNSSRDFEWLGTEARRRRQNPSVQSAGFNQKNKNVSKCEVGVNARRGESGIGRSDRNTVTSSNQNAEILCSDPSTEKLDVQPPNHWDDPRSGYQQGEGEPLRYEGQWGKSVVRGGGMFPGESFNLDTVTSNSKNTFMLCSERYDQQPEDKITPQAWSAPQATLPMPDAWQISSRVLFCVGCQSWGYLYQLPPVTAH